MGIPEVELKEYLISQPVHQEASSRPDFRMLELLKNKSRTSKLFNGNLSTNPSNLADEISSLSTSQIEQGLANEDCGKSLGICRTAVHKGKGWNSHGSVSCHSYGCAVNFATAQSGSGMAHAFY